MNRLRLGAALVPLLFVGVFFLWPVANIVRTGLTPAALDILGDSRTWQVARFTLFQSILSTGLTLLVALPGAWALGAVRFRGAGLARAVLTVPFVLPTVVVAAAFTSLSRSPVTSWAAGGLTGIIAAHVFFNYAVVARVVGAAWAGLDPVLLGAGRTLGATRWTLFRRVTLPYLLPAVIAASTIVFLFTFTSFGVVLILGGTRWSTLEVEIYRRTAQLLDLPAASALALLQLAAVGACLLALSRLAGRRESFPASPPETIRPAPRRAGSAFVALAPAAILIGVPLATLVVAAFSNAGGAGLAYFRALTTSRVGTTRFIDPVDAVLNSALFGLIATALAVGIGAAAAVVIAGRRSRALSLYDSTLMLPLGTSAVTLGFGLLITFDVAPIDLRSSALLVPLAHALVGLPFVIRTLVPALRDIPPALRDAARTMGARPLGIRRRVDLPLAWRAGMVGAGFACAVSLGEFGATAFLARPDRPTIPVAIYRFLGQPGSLNRGQALGLSVILMVLVSVVVLGTEAAGRRRRLVRP